MANFKVGLSKVEIQFPSSTATKAKFEPSTGDKFKSLGIKQRTRTDGGAEECESMKGNGREGDSVLFYLLGPTHASNFSDRRDVATSVTFMT